MNKSFFTSNWPDYELIDAGNGKKLERFGTHVLIRPDVNAYFSPILSWSEWTKKADFEFIEETITKGEWNTINSKKPTTWTISFQGIVFNLELTKFKHIGVFPEQSINWQKIQQFLNPIQEPKFLNLFAYTGGASLAAKKAGADTLHVDSVKQVINWSKTNMESSGLENIRWVFDDAFTFAKREVNRGNKYNGIIMDPPAFGLGKNKKRWKIEKKIEELIELASQLVDEEYMVIINTYSPKVNEEVLTDYVNKYFKNAKLEIGHLKQKTTTDKKLTYGIVTYITNK